MAHPDEFERLALPHLDAAYTLAYWLMRSGPDAEDVVQDAMLRAFRGIGTFAGDAFKPWLLAIVRNCAYRTLSRQRRSATVISLDQAVGRWTQVDVLDVPDDAATPEEALLGKADTLRLDRALAALPEAFREVVVLREVEELSYKEIAHIVGVPIGTVMSRLARGRQELNAMMKKETLKDEGHGL